MTINLNITDGVNTVNKQIPLNDNFIGGIGDYKDILTIDETGSIILVKNIGKVVLNGSESWTTTSATGVFWVTNNDYLHISNTIMCLSNRYEAHNQIAGAGELTKDYEVGFNISTSYNRLYIKNKDCADTTALTTELSSHNTNVYYVLATPTTVDLGSIDISLFKGTNIITNSDNCNMTIKYY